MFYLINKANDILTDPKKKDNYIKYGNPDGPASYSMSIALPSFLFNPKYQLLVLLMFAIFFLGVIPYFVYKWFNSTTAPPDESGLKLENIEYYYGYITSNMNLKEGPGLLSRTIEFAEFNKVPSDEERVELEDLKEIIPS